MSFVATTLFAILSATPLRVIAQQLDCNFDLNSFCNWSNGVNGLEDDFDWQIGNSVAVDGFHSIPRTITGTGNFAYAQGKLRPTETDTARAWLRSPTIDGLSRQASLSFNYWKTAAPPVLQVCTRDAGVSQLRCLDTVSGLGVQQWTRREVVIPPNPLPFQIVFVATNFRTALDLIGLDDIQFRTTTTNVTFLDDANTLQLQRFAELKLASKTAENHVHRRNDAVQPNAPSITNYSRYPTDALDQIRTRPEGQGGRESTGSSPLVQRPGLPQTQTLGNYQPANPVSYPPYLGRSEEIDPRNIRIHQATTVITVSLQQQRRLLQQQQQQQRQQQLVQQQQEEQLRQQRLLELRQKQQQQQLQQFQQSQQLLQQRIFNVQPTPPTFASAPGQAPDQGFNRNYQTVDPAGPQPLPPPGPPLPQQQTFPAPGPAPVIQPADGAFFGPPLPALPGTFAALPVERSEPDIDAAARSTQVLSVFIQRTTPSTSRKFTLPANWFRTVVSRNEIESQTLSPVGPVQAQEATTVAGGHDHGGEHHHHHEGEFGFGVCQAVTCTFETTSCAWYNDLNANFDWKLKNNQSQYQGIPQDFHNRPSYLFVSGDQRRPDQTAVIRSQPFVAPSGAYLEFFSFVTDPTVTRLSAYRNIGNDQPNVLWQTLGNGQVDKNNWQRARVPLPASSFPMTISIVADQLSTGQYIGVDDLRLVDNGGVDVGCAADTTFTSLGSTRVVLLTPFPPKEGGDDSLRSDLQLTPLKAIALLNNPGEELQFAPPQSFNSTAPPGPSPQSLEVRNPPPRSNQRASSGEASPVRTAVVQQRRIGVIETQGLFGGDTTDSDPLQQQILLSTSSTPSQQAPGASNGVQISSVDKNGQRRGLLQSIERQSQQWNVFQPAKPDELPREIIYATQVSPIPLEAPPTAPASTTTVRTATQLPSFTSGSGPALRSVDPIFPPGDSPESNDQDAFYKRQGVAVSRTAPRNAARRGPPLRVESNDAVASVLGASENGLVPSVDEGETKSTTYPTSTKSITTANPDPLGLQDFVSSLTRDLQVLAGGGAGSSSWQQSGSPLSNFHNGNGLSYSPLGATALGLRANGDVQPQPTNNAAWLQSIFGKRK